MPTNTASTSATNQEVSSHEVIGLLTAISIVSRRMATKLALLDERTTPGRGDAQYGRAAQAAAHADQGHAV